MLSITIDNEINSTDDWNIVTILWRPVLQTQTAFFWFNGILVIWCKWITFSVIAIFHRYGNFFYRRHIGKSKLLWWFSGLSADRIWSHESLNFLFPKILNEDEVSCSIEIFRWVSNPKTPIIPIPIPKFPDGFRSNKSQINYQKIACWYFRDY